MIDLLNRKSKKIDLEIELGNKYRDMVSGFTGIATGLTMWLSGCDTVGLNPGIDKDGKLMETQWFDINRVKKFEEKVVTVNKERPPGGPHITPRQNLG